MIKVKGLCKSFNNINVLDNVCFDIEKGDVIAILGPSGAGKTTILRCLNFLTKADKGTLEFEGENIELNTVSNAKIKQIRKKTGFVFQNFNLFLNKTAIQNVMLGLTIARKKDKAEAETLAKKMLDKVGLQGKYESYPSELSGGQQQRVGIARALATSPDIIYFDEPTSALDPELIGEVLNVIKELANDGMTMVIVTHEMNFAKSISNKVLFLDNDGSYLLENTKDFFENQNNERIKNFIRSIRND